jgi:iron complex outermembrane receptor protein
MSSRKAIASQLAGEVASPRCGRRGALAFGALLALAALAPSPAAAQTDLSTLPMEQLLDVEVYAASRFAQRITGAPAAVTVITAQEIKQFGYRSLAEVLRSVRGIDVRSDRVYDYVGVRGFSRSGDYNTGLTVLIDGYRVNDNVYDTGFIGTELGLDVDLIERVEVLRGLASALYGGNSVLGVVNIVTRAASSVSGIEVAASGGSYGFRQGRATLGKVLDNGAQLLLSATLKDVAGPSLFVPDFNQPENNFGRTRGTDFEYGHSVFGKFSQDNLSLSFGSSRRTKGNPIGLYGAAFNDPGNWLRDASTYVNLAYYRDLAPGRELGVRLYLGDYTYTGHYLFDPSPRLLNDDSSRGSWWGGEIKLKNRLDANHHLVLGAEYQRNYRQDQRSYDNSPFELMTELRYKSSRVGFYVEDEYALNPKLTLAGNLRVDKHTGFGAQWSPRLAAIYKPTDATVWKLVYGAGYRNPSAYERFYSFPDDQIPNPTLGPERARNVEVLFEHYLAPRTRILGSLYRYRIDRVVFQERDPVSGVTQFRNGAAVVGRGIEAELEHLWENGARLRTSIALGSARTGDGSTLLGTLRRQAKLNLSLPLPFVPLNLGLEGLLTGRRRSDVGEVGGFGVLNLTLLYPADHRRVEASFSIYNLFDRRYLDPVALEPVVPDRAGIEQDGRSFRFKLQYWF